MSLYGQESALNALTEQLQGFRGGDEGEPTVGSAATEDGRVAVDVAGGVVSSLTIDVRAMRDLSNAELADAIRETVNSALRQYAEARAGGVDVGAFEALLGVVEGISSEAERDFGRQLGALDKAMQQVEQLAARQADQQQRLSGE